MIDDKRDDDEDLDEEDEDEADYEDEEDEDDEEEDEEYEEDDVPRIEAERVKWYKKTLKQLQTFHREISIVSHKKPDSPLNKFKLGLINETMGKANLVLGDEFRPFPDFTTFDEANMPSASDVVVVISHYVDGFHTFRQKYYVAGHWRVTDHDELDEDADDL